MTASHRVFATRALPGAGFAELREDPAVDLDVWPVDFPPTRAELLQHVAGVDGLLCLITDTIDDAVLDAAGKQLKVVSQMAVGVDNVDVAACAARGIPVGNTPGVLTETTADMAWALILSAARRVVEAAEYVKRGQWQTWTPTQMAGVDVFGSTLGVIGFGAIGQAIARRAQGFGMRTLCWNRTPRPAEAAAVGAEQRAFDEVLSQSDFVCVSVALTDDTRNLIDARAFELMKPNAILVNTARGPIVDEAALVDALRERRIGGAGLDVTAVEPLAMDSPLLEMDNVVVLPHIGSASMATRGKMADMAVANLRAGLAGRPLPNSVGA
ncbi:MAG: D-glycerate dehydrogenase [Chloroflexi bacterium]|nr:D-glycerate dehydrogenase [Chloroflexota bacterium]